MNNNNSIYIIRIIEIKFYNPYLFIDLFLFLYESI